MYKQFLSIRIMGLCFIVLIHLSILTANANEITIATLEWPPYVMNSKIGQGSSAEIIKAAFNAVGHDVKFLFVPWARAIKYAKSGKVDAIAPIYHSLKREEFFYFSSSFQVSPLVLFKNSKSKIIYKTEQDLENYTLGLVRGYKNTDFIDSSTKIAKSFVQKDLFNLKKLAQNHVELIVVDEFVAKFIIAKNLDTLRGKLDVIRPDLDSKKLHLAFSKRSENSKKFKIDFEKGLEKIRPDLNEIIRKSNLKFGID